MSAIKITSKNPDAVVRAFIDMGGYRVIKPLTFGWFRSFMVVAKDRRSGDRRKPGAELNKDESK